MCLGIQKQHIERINLLNSRIQALLLLGLLRSFEFHSLFLYFFFHLPPPSVQGEQTIFLPKLIQEKQPSEGLNRILEPGGGGVIKKEKVEEESATSLSLLIFNFWF